MEQDKALLLKNYLSNLKVEVGEFGYMKVWPDWRDIDYTPNYNKFYFICDGEGWLKVGNQEYYPNPGQMFLMPEGVLQSYSAINTNTFTKYWCHFTAKVGDLNLFDIIKPPLFFDVKDISNLKTLFSKLIEYGKSAKITSGLGMKAVMLELICFYIENSVISDVAFAVPDSIQRLKSVTDYIENNLRENISVESLAKIAHLHPNYFIRFFRRHLGASPIHYINKRRVEEAKRLLEIDGGTLNEIGSRVGIGDIYYFSRMFKEYTGYSPSEYKKMMKGNRE